MCVRPDRRLLLALTLILTVATAASIKTLNSSAATRTFTNPVYKHNFPDPFVLRLGRVYYAYATNNGVENVQVIHSHDLVHWTGNRDALPVLARWTISDVWAPEVLRRSDGKFVLFYAAFDVNHLTHCLGHGVSNSPLGPFRDTSTHPFECQPKLGGDIDPDVLRDGNGRLYLYWKSDGISVGMTDYIFGQKLAKDGLRLLGKPTKLIEIEQGWEGPQIEAPTMWKHAGKYYLFFSGSMYNTANYAVGYATCKGPLGPCRQARDNPILQSKCKAAGPGGQTIATDARGGTWMLYHAWPPRAVGDGSVGRWLWMDRLDWKKGRPVVHGPTCRPQTAPPT